MPIYGKKIPKLVARKYCLVYRTLRLRGTMNYLLPKNAEANNGALDESALKRVSVYPNLGSRKLARNGTKLAKGPSFYNAQENMITAAQLRAARGLLDWTRADLAKAANSSPETVKNIEHGTFKPQ